MVMSHFESEAWGWGGRGGGAEEGSANWDLFCVQAAIALSGFSLLGLSGRKTGEGATAHREPLFCLECLRMFAEFE